jgi:hypothetical protein
MNRAVAVVISMILASIPFQLPFTMDTHYASSSIGMEVITYLSNPSLHNLSSEEIATVEVGQQSIVSVSLHNNLKVEQPLVIIIEVRDGDGVTKYLAWQTAIVNADGNYTMTSSWTPTEEGTNYQIRSFAITDFQYPQVISKTYSSGALTVVESPHHIGAAGSYAVTIGGKVYNIQYAMGSGRVQRIEVDPEAATFVIALKGVREQSTLEVHFLNEMLEQLEVASNLYYCFGNEFAVFVDEKLANFTQANIEKEEIITVSIEGGTETVEIIGTNLLLEPPTCD